MQLAAEDFDIMHIAFSTRVLQLLEYGNVKRRFNGKEDIDLEELCTNYIDLDNGNLAAEIVNGLISFYEIPDSLTQVDDFDLYDNIYIYLTEGLSNQEYDMSPDLRKVLDILPNIK